MAKSAASFAGQQPIGQAEGREEPAGGSLVTTFATNEAAEGFGLPFSALVSRMSITATEVTPQLPSGYTSASFGHGIRQNIADGVIPLA
jgi:hypothetical protein